MKIKYLNKVTFITVSILLILSFYSSAYSNKEVIANDKKINFKLNRATLLDRDIEIIYDSLHAQSFDLDFVAFKYALIGYSSLLKEKKITNERYISIIDFNKTSDKKRFYTIDLDSMKIIYHTYVAHGKNSGSEKAQRFSDKHQSRQSSIGFYITGETYMGSKGFSLKLHGNEAGYNKNIYDRGVVIHTENYVSKDYLRRNGRLGRSWGCPVLPANIYKEVINTIKGGSVIFAYYNDKKYLHSSKYLKKVKKTTPSLLAYNKP